MGEGARRKKLDPNYGKIPTPPSILVNSWHKGKCLAFIRCVDLLYFRRNSPRNPTSGQIYQTAVNECLGDQTKNLV